MVKVPAVRVLVLSPKTVSPLLSNCAAPLLVMVTTVLLLLVAVLLNTSWAVTVVVKVAPAVWGRSEVSRVGTVGAGLMTMAEELPVLVPGSVAVRMTDWATLSLLLMLKLPAVSVFVFSPNMVSPLLSNCAAPLLVMVTTVLLLLVAVLLNTSWAVTVVVKVAPAVWG